MVHHHKGGMGADNGTCHKGSTYDMGGGIMGRGVTGCEKDARTIMIVDMRLGMATEPWHETRARWGGTTRGHGRRRHPSTASEVCSGTDILPSACNRSAHCAHSVANIVPARCGWGRGVPEGHMMGYSYSMVRICGHLVQRHLRTLSHPCLARAERTADRLRVYSWTASSPANLSGTALPAFIHAIERA